MLIFYDIIPVPKPRMVKSDAWKKRPPVMRYWAFKAECRAKGIKLPPDSFHVHFIIPMPDSWSLKKKSAHNGQRHLKTPDGDNLIKALQDALLNEDCAISDFRVSKWWGITGHIVIEPISPSEFPVKYHKIK